MFRRSSNQEELERLLRERVTPFWNWKRVLRSFLPFAFLFSIYVYQSPLEFGWLMHVIFPAATAAVCTVGSMVIDWMREAGSIAEELKKELATKDRPEID